MPPKKFIRTYSRGNNSSISCMEALDILFAKNKTEKKLAKGLKGVKKVKKKIQIKELPQKIKSFLVDESSLHVNFDDTFDRLLKGDQCNVVKAKDLPFKKLNTNACVLKKHLLIEKFTHFHSPIFKRTRSYASSVEISEIKNESNGKNNSNSWFKQKTLDPIDNSLEIEVVKKKQHKNPIRLNKTSRDSPILLRSTDKREKPFEVDKSHNKINIEPDESLDSKNRWMMEDVKIKHPRKPSRFILNGSIRNSPILLRSRGITPDISIESVIQKNKPNILNTDVFSIVKETENGDKYSTNIENHKESFGSFFSQSLREKILVHSSTPLVSNIKRNIIKQPLSPIKTDESMGKNSESINSPSRSKLVKDAIADSIKEINSWNTSFPKINDKINDSYHLNLDNFAGSNVQEQLINMGTFLRQKRENLMNGNELIKSKHTNVSSGQSKRAKLFKKLLISKSYSLEDFERFHSFMTLSDSSDSNKTFSLKDFEAFHKEFSNKHNYVTKRKSKVAFKKHIKSLHKKFDLKNLFIRLDDILNNKSKGNRKTTRKSFPTEALLQSFTVKQPVVNLTRLSLNNLHRAKEKNCLEKMQSSHDDRLQDNSLVSNFSELEDKTTYKSQLETSMSSLMEPTSDTEEYIIDLTDENIENHKENSPFIQKSYVNVKYKTKQKKNDKLTKKLVPQSTPLQEKDRKNSKNSRVNLVEAPWTIDLTVDENTNREENENFTKSNTQQSSQTCHNSNDEYCIDLTEEDPDYIGDVSQYSGIAPENEEDNSQNLENDYVNDKSNSHYNESNSQRETRVSDCSEDPERTKSDLEELFGITSLISVTDTHLPNGKNKKSEVLRHRSPQEFYGFNSVSEPVLVGPDRGSALVNRESGTTCSEPLLEDRIISLGDIHHKSNEATNKMLIKRKLVQPPKTNKIDVKIDLLEKSRLEKKRMSLEDILNNMFEDNNTNLSNNAFLKVKGDETLLRKKKYSLRSKYAQEIQNNNKKLDNTRTVVSSTYFSEISSNQSSFVDESNASIFFKSLQLLPKSSLNYKHKDYNLRSRENFDKQERKNTSKSISHRVYDNENTLPDICDPKNLVLNATNSTEEDFVQIVEEDYNNFHVNECAQLIQDDDDNSQGKELVIDITLMDLKAQTNHESAIHDKSEDNNWREKFARESKICKKSVICKKNGNQSQDIEHFLCKQTKSVPTRVSKDLVVDLTARNFSSILWESNKILDHFDTRNIVITDPMEEELEISYSTPKKNSVRSINDSTEVSSRSTLNDMIDSSINSFTMPMLFKDWNKKRVTLKAGKSWRRSLLTHRRDSCFDVAKEISALGTSSLQNSTPFNKPRFSQRRQSMRIVPVQSNVTSRKTSILQSYALHNLLDESETNVSAESVCSPLRKSISTVSAREIVLKRCGQTEPLPFTQMYPPSLLKDCKKIGEGVYGEVFLYKRPNGQSTVMKVIPIEGSLEINGEKQKKYEEILSEIIISSELSELRSYTSVNTHAFCEVQRICCVKGTYPDLLLDLWEQYDEDKGSENECPKVFSKDQLYIVLDLANAGQDLEAFVFNNASQACAMFQQVACALACAEEKLKFEHRDLHWGNVLLRQVDKNTKVTCRLRNKEIVTQTKGVEATIIDFTLSRMTIDGVVLFNDLSKDPDLFLGEGDYQFEIYRKMKTSNVNNWEKFEPYSNILWLHYVLDKSIGALRYKNTTTKIHSKHIEELKKIERTILGYSSVNEFVSSFYC